VNDVPVAANDSVTTNENVPITFSPCSNDSDADGDTLTITARSNPSHGSVAINSGMTLTYTPAATYYGSDSFTYTISDGHGGTATATVSVTVNYVNYPPVANADSIQTDKSVPATFDPRTNDADQNGDGLTIMSVGGASHGTVTINSGATLTYMPTTGYYGSDSFTYTISDNHGGTATATVSVTVNYVNKAPIAVDDVVKTYSYGGGGPYPGLLMAKFSPLTNDSDPDGDDLTIISVTSGAYGSVSIFNSGRLPDQDKKVVVYQCSNTEYIKHFSGDTFTYTISDGHGGTSTATVKVK